MSTQELIESMRVRLLRDPGDELLIRGKPTKVRWPNSFFRVGPGLFAEVVVDLPTMIQTFPSELWTGPLPELLEAGWRKTLNRVPSQIRELEAPCPVSTLVSGAGWQRRWWLRHSRSWRWPGARRRSEDSDPIELVRHSARRGALMLRVAPPPPPPPPPASTKRR